MKVYTKTGDSGTTSLIGGERVPKDDARVEAYGTVDELAAHIALLGDFMSETGGFDQELSWIEQIQSDLMLVEALLAGSKSKAQNEAIEAAINRLETQIDSVSEDLPPVKGFIIPGGHRVVSQSHVCRTVCRRVERRTVSVTAKYNLCKAPALYLNRLSDWLYVAGRKAAKKVGGVEKFSIFVP